MSPTSRSIFAFIDGLLLFLALEAVFYAVALLGLNKSFDTPTVPYLTCNLVWSVLAALLAGYTAARVARRSPVAHGLALAVPFLALAIFNIYKGWGDRRMPFVLGWNILVPVCCVVGAWLYAQARHARHIRARRHTANL